MVYSTNIEPVISLKRASDSRLCVLCQQRHISKDDVRQSTECSSCLNVYEAMKMRIMLRDIDHREAIERLEGVIESCDDDISIVSFVNATRFSQVKRKSTVCRRSTLTVIESLRKRRFCQHGRQPEINITFVTNHSSAFRLHDVRVVKNVACLSSLMKQGKRSQGLFPAHIILMQSRADETNWEMYVFCQCEESKERLSSVVTFNMSV